MELKFCISNKPLGATMLLVMDLALGSKTLCPCALNLTVSPRESQHLDVQAHVEQTNLDLCKRA